MDPKDRIWRISRSKLRVAENRGLFGIPIWCAAELRPHGLYHAHWSSKNLLEKASGPLEFFKARKFKDLPKSTRNLCFEWESIKIVRTLSFKFPWTYAKFEPYASTSCRLQNCRASYGARIPLGWGAPSCLTPGKNPFRKGCTQQMPTI